MNINVCICLRKKGHRLLWFIKSIRSKCIYVCVFNTKLLSLPGADLASPSNHAMLKAMLYISGLTSGVNCGFYIGIHSWFSEGDFTSIEGDYFSHRIPVDVGCKVRLR